VDNGYVYFQWHLFENSTIKITISCSKAIGGWEEQNVGIEKENAWIGYCEN
jgi:hypothetical protein